VIFAQGYIPPSMEPVLNRPMASHQLEES
jgi:hypothetical protein